MTCETFRDRVFDFLDGTLQDRGEFQDHRASCPSCAAVLRGIEWNEKALLAARAPLAPAGLWSAIATRISEGRELPFRRTGMAALVAAAAGLLVAFALFFSIGGSKPRLDVQIVEATPEVGRTMGALVPRYEDVDAATALAETLFR